MRYEIISKNDLSSGAKLVVQFPEEDLDRKALYTIQSEWPDFLIPFLYRSVDGMAECTYQLDNKMKLQYRYGKREKQEYIKFWEKLLRPLMDCVDWFLRPLSFVLEPPFLYTDKLGDVIQYLYIPSKKDCVEADALQKMVIELSRQNSVTDPALENKVLRAIMQEFQPKVFLKMLEAEQQVASISYTAPNMASPPVPQMNISNHQSPGGASEILKQNPAASEVIGQREEMDEIEIHFEENRRNKEKKKGFSLFGGKKEEKESAKSPEKKSRFLGRQKESPAKEIVLGAAAKETPKVLSDAPVFPSAHFPTAQDDENEVTQLEGACGQPHLRLVGDLSLPREIAVDLEPGQVFTVGRFDVSVGHQQSSFEFDKKTKAVSRHHAAIERTSDGSYVIVDLVSSAGTFLDGQRLTPNISYPLTMGCRISFGTGGADYIWEE